jgi:hypothetical protein
MRPVLIFSFNIFVCQRFLLQVHDTVYEKTQTFPSIDLHSPSAYDSRAKEASPNAAARILPKSPSKMGISESNVSSIADCSPELLVEKYFQKMSTRGSKQERSNKNQ